MTIPNIPSKGRMSVIKIHNFTVQRRQSLIRIIYGGLLFIISIIMFAIDPVNLVTDWFLDMREGSFVFKMWQKPTYEVKSEVWVFNYTNVDEYLAGIDTKLKLEEIGPFVFREHRTNLNMSVDSERGILKIHPNTSLEFMPELSVGHYSNITVNVPSIAILAISTLLADKFGYMTNAGAYYSMKALDSRLFRSMTVEQYFFGYYDPVVLLANKLLPGWIDFKEIGIMDRFYAQKDEEVELELKDIKKKYSIKKWAGSEGIRAQGFKNLQTSTPCNRIEGAYEGLMVAPHVSKDMVIPVFRKQACRVYPFSFQEEVDSGYGFNVYRFTMEDSAFNKSSRYACKCDYNCLPDGFVDIGSCYYGFPIALSKPHFVDVDPEQMSHFEGLVPDREKYKSILNVEPTLGVPLSLSSRIQVNLAVRSSTGNPITYPLKDKILPLLWLTMFVEKPPPDVILPLQLRFVYAPPAVTVLEVVMLIAGVVLCVQGFLRLWRPKYQLVDSKPKKKVRRTSAQKERARRTGNVILNMSFNKAFNDDEEDLGPEAMSLLAIREDFAEYIDRGM